MCSSDLAEVHSVPLDWFRLTKEQINRWIGALEAMAGLPDPLRQMAGFYSPRQCYWMPIGSLGLAYEGLPEVAAMAIGMSLKTANRLTLRSSLDSRNPPFVSMDPATPPWPPAPQSSD